MEASLFLDWLNSSGFSKTKKAFLKESKFDISSFSAPATNVREILATLNADKGDDSDSDSSSDDSSSSTSSAAASAKVSSKPTKRSRTSSVEETSAPPTKKRKIDAANDSSSDDDSDEDDDIKTATPKDADDASDSTASGDAKEPETEADAEPANTEDVYGAAPGTDADANGDATPGQASPGKETGVCVKWNHEKGFGFITRDNGKGDLFCHVNECWFSGSDRNVKVGSKVEFTVEKGEKGEASVGVTGVGGVECSGGKQMAGTMKNWLEDKEFGFVQPDDGGDDMFVGNRDAFNTGSRFYAGDRVDFDVKVKADGRKQAVFVTLEGGVCKLCNICGEYGHLSKDCPGVGAAAKPRPATPRAPAPAAPVHEKGSTPPPTEGKATGVVRMWRHEKGFGFIKVDGKEEEVFAHVNDIYAPSGWRNAKVGSRVEFDYVENAEKGGSASEVHGIGGGDVEAGRSKGTMSRWLGEKGFGFVMPDGGGEELFTGDRDCWEASGGFNDGDRVEFDVKTKESGKVLATYVTLEGNLVLQCRECEGVGYTSRDCPICNGTAEEGAAEGAAEEAW